MVYSNDTINDTYKTVYYVTNVCILTYVNGSKQRSNTRVKKEIDTNTLTKKSMSVILCRYKTSIRTTLRQTVIRNKY